MKALACLVLGTCLFPAALAEDGPLWIKPSLVDIGVCGICEGASGDYVWVMDEGGLKQFDVRDGRCLRVGPRLTRLSYGDPVNASGQVVSWDQENIIWMDAQTGVATRQVATGKYFDRVVASAGAGVAALELGNGTHCVVDLDTGHTLYNLSSAPVFTPDGQWLLKRASSGYLWAKPRSGIAFSPLPVDQEINEMCQGPSGSWFAASYSRVWMVKPGTCQKLHVFPGSARCTFSPDGSLLYRAEFNKVVVYDTTTWTMLRKFEIPGEDPNYASAYRISLVDAGRTLLVFDVNGAVGLDAVSGQLKYTMYESSGDPELATNQAIGPVLLTSTYEYYGRNSIVLRDSQTGSLLRSFHWDHHPDDMTVSTDGARFAEFGFNPPKVCVYRTTDGSLLSSLSPGWLGWVSPDVTEYTSPDAEYSWNLNVHDIATGQIKRSFRQQYLFPNTCVWSPDGNAVIVGGGNSFTTLVDYNSMSLLGRVLQGGTGNQGLSRNGHKVLISKGSDLVLFDLTTLGEQVLRPSAGITASALAPDSRSYVVADVYGLTFSTADGSWSKAFPFASEGAGQLRYSADGALVYYAASNGAVACFRNPVPRAP